MGLIDVVVTGRFDPNQPRDPEGRWLGDAIKNLGR